MSDPRNFTVGLARLFALLLIVCVVAPAAPAQEGADVTPAQEAAIEAAIKELARPSCKSLLNSRTNGGM